MQENQWLKSILGEFQGYINEVKQNAQAQGINADFLDLQDGVLNHRAVMGESEEPNLTVLETSRPCIYIWSNSIDNKMYQIAKETNDIFIKQKQIHGQHLGIELKVISEQEHLRLKDNYTRTEAWVEVKFLGINETDGGDETIMSDRYTYDHKFKELPTFSSIVYYNRSEDGEWNANTAYKLGYNVAHESLHQFLAKAVFYVEGIEAFRSYLKKSTIGTFPYSIYGDKEGHYNSEVNLNMAGLTLGNRKPQNSSTQLREAEKIIPLHFQLLTRLFYKPNTHKL